MNIKPIGFTFASVLFLSSCPLMATSNQVVKKSPEVRVTHSVNDPHAENNLSSYRVIVQHNGKDVINQVVLLHGLTAVNIIQEEGENKSKKKDCCD